MEYTKEAVVGLVIKQNKTSYPLELRIQLAINELISSSMAHGGDSIESAIELQNHTDEIKEMYETAMKGDE